MASSDFVVIDTVHNNNHGESALLVLVFLFNHFQAIFVAVHTDTQRK